MEYPDGVAKPDRYWLWFNTRLGQKYRDQLTGKQCYQFRSSMLQEGPMLRQRLASERVVFAIPGSGSSVGPTIRANRVFYLDLHTFCCDMTDAVRGWLKAVKWTEPCETHMAGIVRAHPGEFRAQVNFYRCSLSTSARHPRGSFVPSKKTSFVFGAPRLGSSIHVAAVATRSRDDGPHGCAVKL